MLGARRRPYVDRVKPWNNAGGAPERGAGAPSSGMRPRRRAWARGFNPARLARCGVAPTPKGAGTAPPSACRPGRNPKGRGAEQRPSAVARPLGKERTRSQSDRVGAHIVVGRPCNIDILLRAILLNLHPTSPPSHLANSSGLTRKPAAQYANPMNRGTTLLLPHCHRLLRR